MADFDKKVIWPGWETVRLIGRGSYGSVYEIQRDMLGEKEKAALKVITIPQSSSDIDELYGEGYDEASITRTFQEHLKSIIAEYSLMRKLNGCSNVVNCDDVRYVQHEDGIGWDIFIKMELLTPLTKALELNVGDAQAIRIGTDICRALQLCRKHNIIHRDIKPANIFVSEHGDYKLGDFGIAKTVEKTSGGTKIGTYEYMAPEVYHDQPYGAAADIYSLGMVLYWVLNEHRTPFLKLPPALPTNSEKEQARKRRFRGEELPAPAHGSPALHKILLKACAFRQEDRYQSPEEMLRDLNALLGAAAPAEPAVTHTPVTAWVENEEPTVGGSTPAAKPAVTRTPVTDWGENEEPTVGSAAPAAPKIERTPFAAPGPEDEDATVGAFRGSRKDAVPGWTAAPTDWNSTEPEMDEDATIGAFFKPRMTKTPASAGEDRSPSIPAEPVNVMPAAEAADTRKEKEPRPKKSKKLPILIGALGLVAILAVALLLWQPWNSGSSNQPAAPTATAAPAHVHEWIEATCDEPRTCKTCGATQGSALGHSWGAWTVVTAPGCEKEGTERRVCSHDSSHIETRSIAATGHDWGSWSRVTEPTCTAAGKETRVCRNDSSHQESRSVDKLGHDWADATYDTPKTCRRCGETEGEVKGYIGYLDGEYGDPVQVSNIGFYAFELNEPVRNCRQLWVELYVQGMGSNSYGRWYIIARDLNGKWQKIGEVNITKDNEDEWVYYKVDMYGTFSFDAITVSPDHYIYQSGTVGTHFWAQVNVD